MSQCVLLTSGISVFRNLERDGLSRDEARSSPGLARQKAHRLGLEAADLAAESGMLRRLDVTRGDQAVLLTTDTEDGEDAARLVQALAQELLEAEVRVERVPGLVLDNGTTFRMQGLPNFIQALDRGVEGAYQNNQQPCLAIGGGIQAVSPYAVVYGMLRHVPVTYLFERTGERVVLPSLPLEFDWNGLQRVKGLLNEISKETAVARGRLVQTLGEEELGHFAALFEPLDDDHVTLSAFGLMLVGDLDRAAQSLVMLSSSALEVLNKSDGVARRQFEFMLSRLPNPLWRAHKAHAFPQTDLQVWKPGSTAQRIAGWVDGETIYVAELYSDHDTYVRDLPQRRRKQYPRPDFSRYEPREVGWPDPLTDEEEHGQQLVEMARTQAAQAVAQRARWEQWHDEAFNLAEEWKQRYQEAEGERARLQKHVTALGYQRGVIAHWGLLRRLRWALFGSPL